MWLDGRKFLCPQHHKQAFTCNTPYWDTPSTIYLCDLARELISALVLYMALQPQLRWCFSCSCGALAAFCLEVLAAIALVCLRLPAIAV